MRNKLGLNYWVLGGFEGALAASEAIDLTATWKLDCLELTVPDLLPTDLSSSEGSRILRRAASAGVSLETLASGYYWDASLGSTDREERQRALDFTREYIALANRLEIGKILITGGTVGVGWDASRPVTPYGEVWKHTAASIGELEPVAARAGVTLCIENVWNQFLLSPVEMQIFVDQFASDRVGVYFDVGNVRPWGHPEHWIDLLGSRIKAVHIKNFAMSDGLGGLHGFTDDLARGDVDFEALRGAMERRSYEGPLIAEMIPFCRLPDLGLPDRELAEKTAGELRRLFK